MTLGLKELWRTKGRFAAITVAVGFIVFLALILSALADGLFLSNTGALRTVESDGYVYAADSDRSFSRSELPNETVDGVAAVDGVADAGPVAFLDLPVTIGGELASIVLAGFETDGPGGPGATTDGELPTGGLTAVADSSLADDYDIGVGDSIELGDMSVEIVGFADDVQYLGGATVWMPFDGYVEVRNAMRPELTQRDPVQTVSFAVVPGDDPATVADAITAQLEGVEALPIDDAVLALPAVAQQETTFTAIVGATYVVVALVVALFFALITMEKRTQYAVLKAIGARSGTLAVAVFIQAVVTATIGYVLGWLLTRLIGFVLPSSVPATFVTSTAVTLLVATIVMGAIGAVLSFRRIARIDPASALGGAA